MTDESNRIDEDKYRGLVIKVPQEGGFYKNEIMIIENYY